MKTPENGGCVLCPICKKQIDLTNKDAFYDAYEFDGVKLSNGDFIMIEDHGPHYRFHRDCTLGYKNNGHGFFNIIIDAAKDWR